ncbi:MAG: nicotinate-nucleotide adenylyltransferase [Culicoidibacterales bacterium]
MKIGLFGGTFDPIHNGHLAMAQVAQTALQLDSVWFIPVYTPPHKERTGLTSGAHRLKMIEHAIAHEPTFSVSKIELERERTSYTYETIQQLRQQYPEAEFYFLLGADNIAGLGSWKELAYLLNEVTFVAFARPDHDTTTTYPVIWLDMPLQAVSSTAIRNFQAYNYLNPQVLHYMLRHHLYGLTAIHELVFHEMSYQRFVHTMGVVETAVALARCHGLNERQCHVAALLHDYAKATPKAELHDYMSHYFPEEPFIAPIAHAYVGSITIQEDLCITDPEVIDAVRYHTTGHPDMGVVAKCIFIADYIEPNRQFLGVEQARQIAYADLEAGLRHALAQTNAYLQAKGKMIHPDSHALFEKLQQLPVEGEKEC